MENKLKLHPVEKVHCKKCGELLMKVYPNGAIAANGGVVKVVCIKCHNEGVTK